MESSRVVDGPDGAVRAAVDPDDHGQTREIGAPRPIELSREEDGRWGR